MLNRQEADADVHSKVYISKILCIQLQPPTVTVTLLSLLSSSSSSSFSLSLIEVARLPQTLFVFKQIKKYTENRKN
jgi:hypothetical protein